jgi:hypothetical protein
VLEYDSFEHWVEMTSRLAGPVRALLANLDAGDRAAIERRLREMGEAYERDDGTLALPQRMVVAGASRT